MFKQQSFILFLLFLIFISCSKDKEPIIDVEYPILFSLEGMEHWNFNYYTFQDPGFNQINITQGSFLNDIDYELFEADDYITANKYIELKEIEILSDTLGRIFWNSEWHFDPINHSQLDTTVSIKIENDSLFLTSVNGNPWFSFPFNFELTELRYCIHSHAFNYFDTHRQQRTFSGVGFSNCKYQNSNEYMESLVGRDLVFGEFQRNDTIAIHYSDIIWKKSI